MGMLVSCLTLILSATSPASTGSLPVTVVTTAGESVEGRFVGASSLEVTVATSNGDEVIPLAEVSYISFVGRPADVMSFAKPATKAADLRMQGKRLEASKRYEEALARYEEAERLDPDDPLTMRALKQIHLKIRIRNGRAQAAPFKTLVPKLRDARRYREAAACYEAAIRLDPYDEKFRDEWKALRHYWEPSECPVNATEGHER